MRVCIFLFLAAAFACGPAIAAEQVFTWVDGHGTVHYADTPPADGAAYKILDLATSRVTGTANTQAKDESSSSAPASDEDPADDATKAADNVASTGKTRKDVCAKLTSNITLLKSKQIVVAKDAKGTSKVLDAKARQQQLATSEQQYKQFCQG